MVVTHIGNDGHVMLSRGEKRPYGGIVEATTLKPATMALVRRPRRCHSINEACHY
jgi:hypothetical protein